MALRPTVSVIVPCYNYGEFLADCVQSVISQAGVNTEVLIIDDASTDRSPLVAAELAARHPNVEARVHPENHGHIATYNEGVQWATGDYLVLLSADDLLVDGALDRSVSVMERHRNVGLTYGRARGFSGPPPTELSEPGNPKVEIVSGRRWFERVCQDGENAIAAPEAVVRTSVHHQVGGYDARLPHSADLELWLRIALHSDVAQIHGNHALKRSHGGSMQAVQFFDPVPRLKQREDAFLIALEHYKAHFGDHERLSRHGAKRACTRWFVVDRFDSPPENRDRAENARTALLCLVDETTNWVMALVRSGILPRRRPMVEGLAKGASPRQAGAAPPHRAVGLIYPDCSPLRDRLHCPSHPPGEPVRDRTDIQPQAS